MRNTLSFCGTAVGVVFGLLLALPASGRVEAGAITIVGAPATKTTATTATFAFTINPGWGTNAVACELDGKIVETGCKSPKTFTGLAVGEHTFTITAYATEIAVGKDSRTWIVDSVTPDFFLKANPAQFPLTTRLSSSSAATVSVQIVRLGGSKGSVQIPGATPSGNAFVLTLALGLEAKVVPDVATNPSTLTVSLSAKSFVKPVIGKSFTLKVAPASPAVGPAPRVIVIPYAVVDEYDLVVQGIDVTQAIQPDNGLPSGPVATYGGVKLVKDKRTMVRVFAAVASPPSRKVSGARIFLYGWWSKNGAAQSLGAPLVSPSLTLDPGGDVPVSLSMLELQPPAATFTLPPFWTEKGPITLEAKVLPASLFQPQAESECSSSACAQNNTFKLVNIPFVDTGYVNVWALYLKLRGGFDPCCPGDQFLTYLPSVALAAAQQLMPLADGALRDDNTFVAEYDVSALVKLVMTFPAPLGCPGGCSLNDYLITLSTDLEFHQVCPGTPSCPDVVMSMIDDTPLPKNSAGWPSPWFAQGVTRGKTSVFPLLTAGSTLVRVRQPLTSVAHELGHSLSLLHASWGCKGAANGQKGDLLWPDPFGYIHGIGVDVRDGAVLYDGNSPAGQNNSSTGWSLLTGGPAGAAVKSKPNAWYDFMSYCADGGEFFDYTPAVATPQQGSGFGNWKRRDAWISVRNWKKLQAFFALLKGAHAAQSVASTIRATFAAEQATLAVHGFLDHSGQVVLTRIRPRLGQPSSAGQSKFELVLHDAQGAELQRWPLTVTNVDGHGAASTFLSAAVPLSGVGPGGLPTNLADLQVVSGQTALARAVRSATAPAVRVLTPSSAQRIGAERTTQVTWTATDPDPGSSLFVAIDYSADDGKGWDTVYEGPNTGQAEIPSSRFSGSSQARIRLRVSDGFNETQAVSERFVAVGHAPVVNILSPRPAEQGRADAPLYLAVTAHDDAGAFLDGRDITWYDGRTVIARGRLASATGLTAGVHVIRALARDAKGRVGEAAVRVRIIPSSPAIILAGAPATISPRARSLSFRLSCSMQARLVVTGPAGVVGRGSCGPSARAVTIPVRPGREPLQIELRAEAENQASSLTLVFARRG